jgi:hypothetical protein
VARTESVQFNIRSRFARERADVLARRTGLTTTQIVEEALRAYEPPPRDAAGSRLIRKGAILVRPADGDRVTLAQAEAALDAVRDEAR